MKLKLLFVISVFFLSVFVKTTEATSGCCSWHGGVSYCDTSVGTYVCNDGSYSPSCGCTYIAPRPTPIVFPKMNATWNPSPNTDKTFSLSVTLDDSNPSQYSAVLSKCRRCDPGPKTDFYSNYFIFNQVKPGVYYLNVKKSYGNYWSTTAYWTIEIPKWFEPSPTPIPTIPIIINNISPPTQSDDVTTAFGVLFFLAIGIVGIYFSYLGILWFFHYAKEHDWVYSAIFWLIVIGLWMFFALSGKPNKSSSDTKSKYICNCSKTCPNMTCAEAYYQLNECGCSARDGDDDGIPCEEQCR